MLVCLCSGTSDTQIRAAVRAGAENRRQVARSCRGAGQGCGSCQRTIDSLIVEEQKLAAAQGRAAEVVEGGLLAAG